MVDEGQLVVHFFGRRHYSLKKLVRVWIIRFSFNQLVVGFNVVF